jgi:hypothetical protein
MGEHHDGAPAPQVGEELAHRGLGNDIQVAGGLIEHQQTGRAA